MKKLLLIALAITGISGAAQVQAEEQGLAEQSVTINPKNQTDTPIEQNQAPLNDGLTEQEIEKRQQEISHKAQSKELSRYWEFSKVFFGNQKTPE